MEEEIMRLGVNIDHVATLRNARTDKVIDLIKVVKVLKKNLLTASLFT